MSNSKLLNLYLSIDSTEHEVKDFYYQWPINNIESGENKFTIFKKKESFDLFFKNRDFYKNIILNCYTCIYIDDNCNSYTSAVINLVEFKTNEHTKKVFLTCYNPYAHLKEQLKYENYKKINCYLIKEEDLKLTSIFRSLDYIVNMNDLDDRINYFTQLQTDFCFIELEIDINFLLIKEKYLKDLQLEHSNYLFKDPYNISLITPKIDVLIINLKENIDYQKNKEFFGLQNSPIFDLDKMVKHKNDYNNDLVTFTTYLDISQNFIEDINRLITDTGEVLIGNINKLFVDNKFSINFGKILNSEQLTIAELNISKNFLGAVIYNDELTPIGIASSLFNRFVNNSKNLTVIFPFNNYTFIYTIRKYLEKGDKIEMPLMKSIRFIVMKPESIKDKFKEVNNDSESFLDIKLFKCNEYKLLSRKKNNNIKDNNKKKLLYNQEEIQVNISPSKIKKLVLTIQDKIKNKTFNFKPFNKQELMIDDEKKELLSMCKAFQDLN